MHPHLPCNYHADHLPRKEVNEGGTSSCRWMLFEPPSAVRVLLGKTSGLPRSVTKLLDVPMSSLPIPIPFIDRYTSMWGGDWAATACSPDAACELDGMEASCEEVLRRCSGREDTLSHSQEELRVMGSLVLRHALGWCGNGPCLHHSLRSRVLEGNASGPRCAACRCMQCLREVLGRATSLGSAFPGKLPSVLRLKASHSSPGPTQEVPLRHGHVFPLGAAPFGKTRTGQLGGLHGASLCWGSGAPTALRGMH